MNTLRRYLAVILLLATTSFAAMAATWEYIAKTYHLISNKDSYLTDNLNKLGKEGWELVNCTSTEDSIVCIFKRPKKQ